MMSKLLYIGHNLEKPKTGGEIASKNMQIVLKMIFEKNFFRYDLKYNSKIEKIFSRCIFFYPGLLISDFKRISNYIYAVRPNYVFIETAQYGALVKYIKKHFPHIKVLTFFHNIEIEYARSYFSLKNIKSWYFYVLTKYNETCSIRYSDYCMTINENDSKLMEKVYAKSADCVFPFSVKNTLSEGEVIKLEQVKQKIHNHKCLFVGSNFFGNTDGLKWFIENVLPKTEIHLTIVGNGMSKAFSNSEKITVFDYVDDLSVFYKETDFVLLPIISGGGMKTKTADALMYGKAIIGTPEVFFGYKVENLHGIYICQSENDFVQAIEQIYKDNVYNFNLLIHKRFTDCHSIESTVLHIKTFFERISKESSC